MRSDLRDAGGGREHPVGSPEVEVVVQGLQARSGHLVGENEAARPDGVRELEGLAAGRRRAVDHEGTGLDPRGSHRERSGRLLQIDQPGQVRRMCADALLPLWQQVGVGAPGHRGQRDAQQSGDVGGVRLARVHPQAAAPRLVERGDQGGVLVGGYQVAQRLDEVRRQPDRPGALSAARHAQAATASDSTRRRTSAARAVPASSTSMCVTSRTREAPMAETRTPASAAARTTAEGVARPPRSITTMLVSTASTATQPGSASAQAVARSRAAACVSASREKLCASAYCAGRRQHTGLPPARSEPLP